MTVSLSKLFILPESVGDDSELDVIVYHLTTNASSIANSDDQKRAKWLINHLASNRGGASDIAQLRDLFSTVVGGPRQKSTCMGLLDELSQMMRDKAMNGR